MASTQENIIKQQADAAIKAQTEAYETQIADTKEQYEDAFRRNETQKILNERYLERKAAEMGLTDSGMNRTQMTANQLNYANQKGTLEANMQKDVNTLAAAMRSKISDIELARDADIAQLKASKTTGSGGGGKVVTSEPAYTEQERKNALSSLETFLGGGENADTKLSHIYQFMANYDATELETRNLVASAGLTWNDFVMYSESVVNNGYDLGAASLKVTPQQYNQLYMAGNVGGAYVDPNDWNYKTNGTLRYNFTIDKATNNWGRGIDYNDRVSIYYPDGTPVPNAQNIKISQLPTNIQQDITNRTAGKSAGDTFYYSCNLSGLSV